MSISAARDVLAAVDDPMASAHDRFGAAHGALPLPVAADPPDLAPAQAHLRRWGWQVHGDSPALTLLANALQALSAAGFTVSEALLDRYARAAGEIGAQDVADVPNESMSEAVRFVVIGTLLLEPVLLALRRLAHEDASVRRFGDPRGPEPPVG